jgi:hypothetical protein
MEITTEENPDHDYAALEGMLKESGIMELSVKETEDIEE